MVVVSHTVCVHVTGPKNPGGRCGAPPPWDGAWLTPKKHAPAHMCYHTKLGRSKSNNVAVSRGPKKFAGVPKNFGRLGPAPWDLLTRRNLLPPTCVMVPNLLALGQTICASVGSNNFGDAGATPPWTGTWLTPRNRACSNAKRFR